MESESKWSALEIEKATERVCIGGKDAGIDFFKRHPSLGFAVAVGIQCEVNALRDALQNLAYLMAQISPPPYGHKCQWCGDCTKRAKDEARAVLNKTKLDY